MFLKIFKYDFITLIKRCAAIYIVLFVATIFALTNDLISEAYDFKLSFFADFVFYVVFFGSLIIPFILCLKRYKDSMLSNEGYLTHTLPVKKYQLLLAKVLVIFAINFISTLACFLAATIYSRGNFVILFGSFFEASIKGLEGEGAFLIIALYFAILFSGISFVMLIITSMTVGNIANSKKGLVSFLFFILYNYARNQILAFAFLGMAFIDYDDVIAVLYLIAYGALLVSIIDIVIQYFITLIILKKKLNLN